MSEYTLSDACHQLIRLAILVALMYSFTLILDSKLWYIAIPCASVLYLLIFKLFQIIVESVSEYESIGTFDQVFFLDDLKNNSNLLGTLYFDEFQFQPMKDFLLKKSHGLHKCRSKVVKMFGMYWFKKMGQKEWDEKKSKVVV
jgi:hypothetical protein